MQPASSGRAGDLAKNIIDGICQGALRGEQTTRLDLFDHAGNWINSIDRARIREIVLECVTDAECRFDDDEPVED